ncbi:VOC family protein [Candidatus Woesearchaeota archaeon]|nr:VOC family protein [Candidatus Woesearchaeota archaeon]
MTKVHHIAITVKDSEKTAKFYKDSFGFIEINRFTKPGWDGGAIVLRLEDLRLEIFQFKSSIGKKDNLSNLKVIGLKHIGIQVDDARKKYDELKGKGIDVDEPVKGTTCAWFCFLRDPDGIPIELYEPNQFSK